MVLTQKETAEYLKISTKTLEGWRARRTGPPYLKIAGLVRYSLADLEKFIKAGRVEPER
jgi:hypothetical protein